MHDFLAEHNIISPYQYGFRPGYSTVEQLILTYNDITAWFDAGQCVNLILFDFAKAFDRVDHALLLRKLHGIGVRGCLLDWIQDFLVGRSMMVSVAGCRCVQRPVSSGVPQGSVLGPLLFLIFVNFLVSSLTCRYMIFADDLKIFVGSSLAANPSLQANVDVLESTASDWGLQFNAGKCVNLRFQRGRDRCLDELFTLVDEPIKFSQCHGDLGVLIDDQLKFHKHVESVAAKAGGVATSLLKSTVCRSPNFMFSLFSTHIRPLLEYGSQVWNTGYIGDLSLLERIQRR
jgi:hypothetical protein